MPDAPARLEQVCLTLAASAIFESCAGRWAAAAADAQTLHTTQFSVGY